MVWSIATKEVTLLDRLSNEKNPKFTKKILEVKKNGVGRLPQVRIVLPKKQLN